MNSKTPLILTLLTLGVSSFANAEENKPAATPYEVHLMEQSHAFFKADSTPHKAFSFWAGFAHLWLNDDLALGNQLVRKAYDQALQKNAISAAKPGTGKGNSGKAKAAEAEAKRKAMLDKKAGKPPVAPVVEEPVPAFTPDIAAEEDMKWQFDGWTRLYYLFSDKAERFPGRLNKENQDLIKELCWNWLQHPKNQMLPQSHEFLDDSAGDGEPGETKPAATTAAPVELTADQLKIIETRKKLPRFTPEHALVIQGTENHEIQRTGAILMASQILKNDPSYKDRKLPGGGTPADVYEVMNRFFKAQWDGMAKHGLLVETFTGYSKYTMPDIYNLADFAEDPELRKKSVMILDTIWAEFAVASFNGIRAGGKTRRFGVDAGVGDTWYELSQFCFDRGAWRTNWGVPNPIVSYPRTLASTSYRVPEVIKDIANDPTGRGEYTYIGKRRARVQPTPQQQVPFGSRGSWWNFDPVDTRALSYDYSTPDYIMGSLLIDPTLGVSDADSHRFFKDVTEGYAAIFAQAMQMFTIFPTSPDAVVCPMIAGAGVKPALSFHTVQHENVMVVQSHPRGSSSQQKHLMAHFSKGMKERIVEKDGWHFLEEGNAYVAVKGFSSKDGKAAATSAWTDGGDLSFEDPKTPLVYILSRKAKHADLAAFQKYVLASTTSLDGSKFTLKTTDTKDQPLELSLYLDASAIPLVNGKPINFLPENVFDSPFFQSKHGSGIINIQKGSRKLVLDFNKNSVTEE